MKKVSAAAILFAALLLTGGGLASFFLFLKYPTASKHLSARWMGAEFLGTDGVLLQKGSNDCGPAALAMVLDHFGVSIPIEVLKRLANLKADGTSMLALMEIATQKGLHAEGWRLSFADLQRAPLPAIALIKRNHFIVVTAIDSKAAVYALDPALGRLRFSQSGFQREWRGEILLFFLRDQESIAEKLGGPGMRRLIESDARHFMTKGGERYEK